MSVGDVPPNFSWVFDSFLAATAYTPQAVHIPSIIQYLLDHNVRYFISLTRTHLACFPDLVMIRIPVDDKTPLKLDQIKEAIDIIDKAKAEGLGVALHSAESFGNTGTIIASYLVREQHYSAKEAIRETHRILPQAIETVEQEKAVGKYEEYLR